jgi:hypothetical protein
MLPCKKNAAIATAIPASGSLRTSTPSIAASLYQKSITGIVGRPRTSLSALTGLVQLPFRYDYAGRGPFDEPSGRETKGYDALSRLYETASGDHLLLCASEADLPRFGKVEGLRGIVEMAAPDREAYLAGPFLSAPAETWQQRLQEADIGVSLCENIETIRSRSARIADGTPGIDQAAIPSRSSRIIRAGTPSPSSTLSPSVRLSARSRPSRRRRSTEPPRAPFSGPWTTPTPRSIG